ncbi:hypothetical protein ACQP1G_02035 [Nocardia sp. CA-107356]|uniref:hypothetical protein n=1 Tax=Nocardia sp. CA-107356 TaxID=3239972 RepID=UPI003D8B714B
MAIAPVEGVTIRITLDAVTAFDHNGWSLDYDDLDKDDAIPVRPTTVIDTEQP